MRSRSEIHGLAGRRTGDSVLFADSFQDHNGDDFEDQRVYELSNREYQPENIYQFTEIRIEWEERNLAVKKYFDILSQRYQDVRRDHPRRSKRGRRQQKLAK